MDADDGLITGEIGAPEQAAAMPEASPTIQMRHALSVQRIELMTLAQRLREEAKLLEACASNLWARFGV